MRPQRVRIIGSSSGCVTWKKPLQRERRSRGATARRACRASTASSWMPALLTRICTGAVVQQAFAGRALAASIGRGRTATGSRLPPACRDRLPPTPAPRRQRGCCAWTHHSARRRARGGVAIAPPERAAGTGDAARVCRPASWRVSCGTSSVLEHARSARPSASGAATRVAAVETHTGRPARRIARPGARRPAAQCAVSRRVVEPLHVQPHAACAGQEAGRRRACLTLRTARRAAPSPARRTRVAPRGKTPRARSGCSVDRRWSSARQTMRRRSPRQQSRSSRHIAPLCGIAPRCRA